MNEPFLIRHPDGREYELSDPAYFVQHYRPQGFVIPEIQPAGRAAPEVPTAKEIADERELELQQQRRAELNELASSLGIDKPESFPNKDALIDAIQAAQDDRERDLNPLPSEAKDDANA